MKIIWQIGPDDIAKVKDFFNRHHENAFVKLIFKTGQTRASLAAISPHSEEQVGKELAC